MLNTDDSETLLNLRLLVDTAAREGARVLVWVGAGASAWCGYPLWSELAHTFHQEFARYEPKYDRTAGVTYLEGARHADFFQVCRDASSARFNSLLTRTFAPRRATPVYERFIRSLKGLGDVFVLTTNVDELLEKNLASAATVGWEDLERVPPLLDERRPFVCKLHGSTSHVDSVVFTQSQYAERTASEAYRVALERSFAMATVVCIGYGLQDEYVIACLRRNGDIARVFGSGPHFAIVSRGAQETVPGLRYIRFKPEPHKDHRAALHVLEEIAYGKARSALPKIHVPVQPTTELRSGHILSDIWPPGSWQTAQTLTISRLREEDRKAGTDSESHELIVGNGYVNEEFGDRKSSAMHDVIVGLLCFDEVLAPLQAIGRLLDLIGQDLLWALVREGTIRLINWPRQEVIAFSQGGLSGSIGSVILHKEDLSRTTVRDILRRGLRPMPGSEALAEKLYAELEPRIRTISDDEEGNIPDLVRSLLVRPSVRRTLGISDGTPMNTIPRWHAYSALRLAHVVKVGAVCRALQLASAKLEFGAAVLAGPAFAAAYGSEWTDDAASYVVTGRYAADLGRIASQAPELLASVMSFRNTASGMELRKHVLSSLAIDHGGDVAVAVNSGLASAVPPRLLQAARDAFVGLMTSALTDGGAHPAIWNDRRYAEDDLAKWRIRSRTMLQGECRARKLERNDQCPCGSGEKLKFCCEESLR